MRGPVAAASVERGPTVAGTEELAGQLLLFGADPSGADAPDG
nr:hypothetical protein OG999_45775 [Streptomyces sp. NBC_00886]